MNVEGSNLLSMLSNSNDLEGLQQAVLHPDVVDTEFSEALMQQIALLKQPTGLTENIDSNALLELAEFAPQTKQQQELAVSKGTKLPPTEYLGAGFDLERTLDVLQDVMQHIADITAFIENASSTVSGAIEQVITQLETELSGNESTAAIADVNMPSIEDTGYLRTVQNVESSVDERSVVDLDDQAELLLQSSKQGKDAIRNEVARQAGIQKQGTQEIGKQEMQMEAAEKKGWGAIALLDQAEMNAELNIEEENALSDFLKKENAFQKTDLENPVIAAKQFEKNPQEIDLGDTESVAHKTLPKVAAEIAHFNRQLNVPAKAEVPGMSKAFDHPDWQQEFGERVLWMHSKSVQAAELRLNPQHLGPVSIRVDINQDQATLAFTAQHSVVREAIEAAMPRLRDMLQGQQINLVDVNVSQDDTAKQQQSQNFAQNNSDQTPQNRLVSDSNEIGDSVASVAEEIELSRTITSRGLLNIFA